MKKIAALMLIGISLYANPNHDAITGFLKRSVAAEAIKYPGKKVNIKDIRFLNSKKIDKDWTGYFVTAKIDVTENGEQETVRYQSIFFTNGSLVTDQMSTPLAKDIQSDLVPKAVPAMYDEAHWIAGNKGAKNKIVLFSDPQCPGCRHWVPKIIEKVKANPNKFVLYFYHYPLTQIHPESAEIVQGMIALHRMGKDDIVERVYREEVNSAVDLEKMFGGYKVTKKDIEHYKNDLEWVEKLAVPGTPGLYVNGELDLGGKKFFSKK